MNNNGAWGTDIELLCFANLTKTCVFSYSTELNNCDRYGPHNVDRSMPVNTSSMSIYLFHPTGNYDLVGSTVKAPSESKCKYPKNLPLSVLHQILSIVWR